MALIVRVTPRLDTAPEHNCGTWFRAGVITVGCPGCQRHTAVGTQVLVHGRRAR